MISVRFVLGNRGIKADRRGKVSVPARRGVQPNDGDEYEVLREEERDRIIVLHLGRLLSTKETRKKAAEAAEQARIAAAEARRKADEAKRIADEEERIAILNRAQEIVYELQEMGFDAIVAPSGYRDCAYIKYPKAGVETVLDIHRLQKPVSYFVEEYQGEVNRAARKAYEEAAWAKQKECFTAALVAAGIKTHQYPIATEPVRAVFGGVSFPVASQEDLEKVIKIKEDIDAFVGSFEENPCVMYRNGCEPNDERIGHRGGARVYCPDLSNAGVLLSNHWYSVKDGILSIFNITTSGGGEYESPDERGMRATQKKKTYHLLVAIKVQE